ncbi:MAG: hypothetical protein ACOYM3_15170 [Terrimicrobiaceae bacterium]
MPAKPAITDENVWVVFQRLFEVVNISAFSGLCWQFLDSNTAKPGSSVRCLWNPDWCSTKRVRHGRGAPFLCLLGGLSHARRLFCCFNGPSHYRALRVGNPPPQRWR